MFIWRPEGTVNVLTAETVEQLLDVQAAPTYDMVVTDMALDPQGGILLVGYLHEGLGHGRRGWVGRLNPDCTPDLGFGGSTTGVRVLSDEEFEMFTEEMPDNSWVSGVDIDPLNGRIYLAGTAAKFDDDRGFFAGQMFVMALRHDGTFEPPFTGGPDRFVGTLIGRGGWHEEAMGIAFTEEGLATPRVVVAGMSYADDGMTSRRVRIASVSAVGVVAPVVTVPAGGVPGLVDAWATDVAALRDGRVVLSVAQRSRP